MGGRARICTAVAALIDTNVLVYCFDTSCPGTFLWKAAEVRPNASREGRERPRTHRQMSSDLPAASDAAVGRRHRGRQALALAGCHNSLGFEHHTCFEVGSDVRIRLASSRC